MVFGDVDETAFGGAGAVGGGEEGEEGEEEGEEMHGFLGGEAVVVVVVVVGWDGGCRSGKSKVGLEDQEDVRRVDGRV